MPRYIHADKTDDCIASFFLKILNDQWFSSQQPSAPEMSGGSDTDSNIDPNSTADAYSASRVASFNVRLLNRLFLHWHTSD